MRLLHHVVTGPASAPPVVFLHGFMGSSEDWSEVVRGLARDHLCVGIDLPGHGRSVHLDAEEDYTFAGACRGVVRVLEKMGLQQPAGVGYSMGGRVAIALACASPARFSRLLLESTSPGLASEAARANRVQTDEERARRLANGDFERFLNAWYAHPLFGSLAARPGLRAEMVRDRLANDPGELARALRGMSPGRQPAFWDRLGRIDAPVLCLAGALDPDYLGHAVRMADLCPRGRVRIVQTAGHNIHREQSDLFLETLRAFLAATGETTT